MFQPWQQPIPSVHRFCGRATANRTTGLSALVHALWLSPTHILDAISAADPIARKYVYGIGSPARSHVVPRIRTILIQSLQNGIRTANGYLQSIIHTPDIIPNKNGTGLYRLSRHCLPMNCNLPTSPSRTRQSCKREYVNHTINRHAVCRLDTSQPFCKLNINRPCCQHRLTALTNLRFKSLRHGPDRQTAKLAYDTRIRIITSRQHHVF